MTAIELNLNQASAIESALALGLKKTKLPHGELQTAQPLAAIALAAERCIYADTGVRADLSLPDIKPPPDALALMPAPLRGALLRVAGQAPANNPVWDAYCRAMARQMDLSGYRIHPFDYCRLEKYLAATTSKPGSYEYWYRQQLTPIPALMTDEAIAWDNWQQFGKAEQQAFLLQQRLADPEAARTALEKDFAAAPATLRQIYVESLEVGLRSTDQAFLESLQTDRSGKVAEAAQRLLARFPGSAAAQQNREALAERLEVQFLTRRIGLVKQKAKKASEALRELSSLTEYMPITDVAAALNLPADELPRKIAQELAFPFARSAAFAQHYGLALSFLQKEDEKFLLGRLSAIADWFEHAPPPDKAALAETAAAWLAGADALDKLQLLTLYELLRQPLPEKAAKGLLNGKAFKAACLQSTGENPYLAGNAMEALAACALLVPKSLHTAYSGKVANIPFHGGVRPADYLAFVDALNAQGYEK